MKSLNKFFNSTQFVITMSVLINLAVFLLLTIFVGVYAYSILGLACLLVFWVLTMFTKNQPHLRFTIALFMFMLPLTATVVYSYLNIKRGKNSQRKLWNDVQFAFKENLPKKAEVYENLEKNAVEQAKLSRYIESSTKMPVYSNSKIEYFAKSEPFIESLLNDLKKAQKYILINLFKIADGEVWDDIFAVLKERRLNGVEIKLIYDDHGCVKTFKDRNIFEKMQNHGIETVCFNPLKGIGAFTHYRNKKNIFIIDGNISYCSSLGVNDDVVLDAKISKMCAVKITGEAIKSVFAQFYSDWKIFSKSNLDWKRYTQDIESSNEKTGVIVQPFISTPFSTEFVSKNIYSCVIANANKSVIISTPYLLLDFSIMKEIIRAVRSGVEVKILIAGKGERTKKYKFALSRHFFGKLIQEGVKIYSYATDNLFNRCIVSDSRTVIVGGGAFDSRKMSVHFENGTLVHGEEFANQVKQDIEATMEVSHLLTIKDMRQRRISEKVTARMLNSFSQFYL